MAGALFIMRFLVLILIIVVILYVVIPEAFKTRKKEPKISSPIEELEQKSEEVKKVKEEIRAETEQTESKIKIIKNNLDGKSN